MRLAIIGQGGHSKVIQDIVSVLKGIEIVGYLDDKYDNSYIATRNLLWSYFYQQRNC